VQAILTRLQTGQEIQAVTDHIMSPTYVDDIATALDQVIRNNASGIYHVTGSGSLTPHELAMSIAKQYSLDLSLIHETTRDVFFAGRAPRPYNLAMNNARIGKLGVKMKTVEEGLSALQRLVDED
jgi:dTDP-4-dehydrorhamnose reductase